MGKVTLFKGFVIVSMVSLHGFVAFVAYEQRAKIRWLNGKLNKIYQANHHHQKSKSVRMRCVPKKKTIKL